MRFAEYRAEWVRELWLSERPLLDVALEDVDHEGAESGDGEELEEVAR